MRSPRFAFLSLFAILFVLMSRAQAQTLHVTAMDRTTARQVHVIGTIDNLRYTLEAAPVPFGLGPKLEVGKDYQVTKQTDKILEVRYEGKHGPDTARYHIVIVEEREK